ncbi:hypothetical protein V1503_24715 [Bacillus sp. SCS-151]|uniref:hypothetical protein n=1 Tax=Nanhaiella sioensis TaxID=3115293 RepID=UPI00397A1527
MDAFLNQKYKDVSFSSEVTEMFADIIQQDPNIQELFLFIGKELKNQKAEKSLTGITVSDITDNLILVRATRDEKARGRSYTYKKEKTNIHRKTAERLVDKLLDMSLLYYQKKAPFKFLFLTQRGVQVMSVLIKRLQRESD